MLLLTINSTFSQNFKQEKKKDYSSYYYYITTEANKDIFILNNFDNLKDYSSFYYTNYENNQNSLIELWDSNNIYIDKLGGIKNNIKIPEQAEIDKIIEVTDSQFPQWIFIIYIISISILAWTNYFYSKYILALFKSFVNYRASIKLFDESNILTGRSAFALSINFFLIITLNGFILINYYLILEINKILMILLILISSIIIYFLKNLIVNFIGNLLNSKKVANIYNFNIGIYNQVLGIILLPILLLISYFALEDKSLFIKLNLLVIVIIYISRIIRSIKIFIQEHFSIFYLFLYLCIIEFLPIYIFIRLYNNVLM